MTSEKLREIKAQQRKDFLEKRSACSEEERAQMSKIICDRIISSYSFKFSDTVLMYSAVRNEADISDVFEQAVKLGKKVYFPKTYGKGKMEFFRVKELSELKIGRFSVPEPDEESERFSEEAATRTLCLVPGAAFDKRGYRIGYGGGYYDRFIKKGETIFAGVTFDSLLCDEVVFDKRHDKKVDMIFTEKRVYVVGKEKEQI